MIWRSGTGLLVQVLQRLGELRPVPLGRVLRMRGGVKPLLADVLAGRRSGFTAEGAFVEMGVLDPVRVFIGHVSVAFGYGVKEDGGLGGAGAARRSGGVRRRV